MPTSKDFSVEDEAYLSTIASEPKMTMDEVGADIDEHGHVPVTPETATQDPFTAKGSLSYALDEALADDTSLEHNTMTSAQNIESDSKLANPTDDFRNETKGEVEGTISTPQGLIQPIESNNVGEGDEPTIQQDKAVHVKDSLAEALDPIAMDGAEEIEAKPPVGKDPEPDYTNYSEETASHIDYKAPDIPKSLGGSEDKPDANGLVYVSATFTVDPNKYVSNNYRPSNLGKMPDPVAELRNASGKMKKQAVNPEEEAAMSDLGTPEAKEAASSPDEPTEQPVISPESKNTKPAQDEAPEKVVLDYATFIDGSSFICFDEVADIDYSKIAMDAGIKKAPTRENCQTTFAQCRAQNPLFCRFHGPKLLEADIKTAIKATVGPGCVVQVTKDKNSKNKFTFRLTVGCPPAKKKMVEWIVHNYLTSNPGISSSTEDWNLVGKHKQTQEFEMDLLQADKPPQKNTKGDQILSNTKKAILAHKKQDVVGETPSALEKKAAKGEKWETVDEAIETEWGELIRDHIQTSGITNNNEFLVNFNKIANQFDAAHDAGDANGLKKALEALKKEVGKYDEVTGAKKPEAQQEQEGEESATNGEVNNGNSSELEESLKGIVNDMNALGTEGMFEYLDDDEEFSQAFMDGLELQKQAEEALNDLKEGNGEDAIVNEKIQAFKKQFEKCKSIKDKKIAQKEEVGSKSAGGKSGDIASFPMAQEAEFAEVVKGHGFEELFTGFETNKDGSYTLNANPHKLSSHVKNLAKALQKAGYDAKTILNNSDDLDLVIKPKAEAGAASKEDGKQDGTVLPAPSSASKTEGESENEVASKVQEAFKKYSEFDDHGEYKAPIDEESQEKLMVSIWNAVKDDDSDFGSKVKDAITKYMDMDEDGYPLVDKDEDFGQVDSPMIAAFQDVWGAFNEDGTVLPAPNAVSKQDGGNAASSPHIEKAKELAKKLFDMKHEFSNVANGADSGTVNALNDALNGAQHTYDKLANQLDTIGELDAQMIAVGEDSDLFEVDKTFEQKLLADSKKKAEGQASVLLDELESALSGIEKSFAIAKETAVDKKKGEVASSVEQMIKNLSVCVFGGKRPPQGVDSVTDYLDYLKDDLESDAEDNFTPDEIAEIEDQYHLEDYYKSTKAAAKVLDDAIEVFKDKMDNAPGQGEDSGAYQAEIEQMQKAIGEQASEVLTNFNAYKNALGHCKYEADAAKKLAGSKKKLEGGGAQGSSSGGEVTKADVADFFDEEFDESDEGEKGSLDTWLEIANKGTWGGGSPKNYFEAVGGWLQDKMKKKGINHPMTKALVKAGLNLPKGMGLQVQGDVSEGGKAEKLTPKQLMEGLPEDFSFAITGNPYVYLDKDSSLSVSDAHKMLEKKFNALGYKIKPIKASSAKKAGFAYYPSVEGKKPVAPFDFDAWQKGQRAQGTQGGEGETKQDLSQKVGDPYSSLQHDIKPLISHALSINGGFTNFETFDNTTVDGTTHFISMEKKQKEGFNEDEDDAVEPTADELATLEKNLNEEFNRHGLSVKPSTHMKNYGKKVYFEVGKKDSVEPSKKQAEPSTPAKSHMTDEEKKAKIAAMSPKQKLEAAVKIFKKKLAANPNDETAKAKLSKYEAMLAKLGK